ncbi:hypothetical protein B9Z44_01815 [Limnohabitans curvus]|uniref:LysM domain-containing protein n=1 Tax=Limnohabitans curvus TaxID=323423 RepID=A0A315ERC8_9BURK|nr:FecR domain-containing protein [Limnohabitans curvus]PUE58442.1 hypothetical protein B9Z44_01815 [Limnohabitans curvus]
MRKAWALLMSAIWLTAAHAQQPDKTVEQPLIVYKIQTGDTLSQLSQKYLRQPADLTAIRSLNHLRSIDLLPAGELLKVPREAVKQDPSHATIISISCARMIRAGSPLKPIYIGTVLEEGVVIDIPAECHVAMRLEDSSIIRLPSSAAIKISVLRKNAMESSPEVQLDLVRGRVELEVYKGRSKTTPFEVRTPLSITGVRGTEFRVGYSPIDQVGQLEVIGGVVDTKGVNDTQSQAITKGQGVPFDKSGQAMPVEQLLTAPAFERAELINHTQASYVIKLTANAQANRYVVLSAKSANLLGEQNAQTLKAPEIMASNLSQVATFYQFASVSNSGLMGTPRQYGFCTVSGEPKSGRCRAVFEAPLADGAIITFSLIKHEPETAQEMVSTKQLQARNGRFVIEGLPTGRYTWSMSYNTTKQSGYFDLIAFTTTAP